MEIYIEHSMFGKNNYQDNTNNAIKFNFTAPVLGFMEFDYERSIKPEQSWTVGTWYNWFRFSILWLGINRHFSGGYRFYRSPDYYVRNLKYAHILKGTYVMPKIKMSLIDAKKDRAF